MVGLERFAVTAIIFTMVLLFPGRTGSSHSYGSHGGHQPGRGMMGDFSMVIYDPGRGGRGVTLGYHGCSQ